jgi:P4 family phage/plasmid primase-like protien
VTDAIYAAHAHSLRKKGYSPLPLPPGEKFPPPFGWTGALAHMASGPDVQFWIETEPADANIALRLPDGVIGIDIDQYGEKTGAESVKAAIEKFGRLPSSGRSSARPAPAGIRLFRVPPGTRLAGTFKAAGLGPHVDIIQHHHRYLVAPPSIHPEGGTYGWYTLQNELAEFPAVEDLPELPEAWIEGLQNVEKEPAVDHPHDAWDAMDARTKNRVGTYVGHAWSEIMAQFQDMKEWDDGYTGEHGGWELTTLALTASLASLVKADWNEYDAETTVTALEEVLPHDGKFTIGNGVSKFLRALENDSIQPRPYPFPEEDHSWFDDVAEAPRPFADAGNVPGTLSESELATTIWPQYEQNDFGNSQRIAAWAKGNLYWLHDTKIWVRYNGVHWEKSPGAGENAALEALNVAYELEMDNYREEKTGDETASPREKFRVWVMGQKMAGKYAAAAKTAQMSEVLNRSEQDFDADPYKLGVLNGTVDLKTGELTKGTKDEMIATVAPTRYDPTAKCPRFDRYLEDSLPDPEVRGYLKRAMGYSITNSVDEQVMFIHHGVTSNGKSVLMNVLAAIMGEYAGGADPKALIESRQEQHSTHVASLHGPRLLLMSETARGARLSDTLIKQITAGDVVVARKLYQENQDLKISGKIHIVTNHLPHIVSSKSTNRRIQLIEWPVEISEEKIDLRLAQKIIANEAEGVLRWLVEGAVEWAATLEQSEQGPIRKGGRPSGLAVPMQVITDTAKYLQSEDEVAEWMDERTFETESEFNSSKNIYADYRSWAEQRGGRAMSQRALGVELDLRQVRRDKLKGIRGYYLGIKPLQTAPWFDEVK